MLVYDQCPMPLVRPSILQKDSSKPPQLPEQGSCCRERASTELVIAGICKRSIVCPSRDEGGLIVAAACRTCATDHDSSASIGTKMNQYKGEIIRHSPGNTSILVLYPSLRKLSLLATLCDNRDASVLATRAAREARTNGAWYSETLLAKARLLSPIPSADEHAT